MPTREPDRLKHGVFPHTFLNHHKHRVGRERENQHHAEQTEESREPDHPHEVARG